MKYGFRYRKKATAVHSIDTVLASYYILEPKVIGMEKVSVITFSPTQFLCTVSRFMLTSLLNCG